MITSRFRSVRCVGLVGMALTCLGIISTEQSINASNKSTPRGTKYFEIEYFWGHSSLPPAGSGPTADLTLYRNGTFLAYDYASGDSGTGIWYTQQGGRTITFDMDGGPAVYVGARLRDGSYEGTMSTVPGGPRGYWRGHYIP